MCGAFILPHQGSGTLTIPKCPREICLFGIWQSFPSQILRVVTTHWLIHWKSVGNTYSTNCTSKASLYISADQISWHSRYKRLSITQQLHILFLLFPAVIRCLVSMPEYIIITSIFPHLVQKIAEVVSPALNFHQSSNV